MPITISDKDLPLLRDILGEKWYYLKDSLAIEHYHDDDDKQEEFCKLKGLSSFDEVEDDLYEEFRKWIRERIAKEHKQVEKILGRISKKL